MPRLLISANLGHMRVFSHSQPDDDPQRQPHWIELPEDYWHQTILPLREQVSDQAGRFSQGQAAHHDTGMSIGEEHQLSHHLNVEAQQHLIMAIERVLADHGHPAWILAAPKTIIHVILQHLIPHSRNALVKQVVADLSRCPVRDLEKHIPA